MNKIELLDLVDDNTVDTKTYSVYYRYDANKRQTIEIVED